MQPLKPIYRKFLRCGSLRRNPKAKKGDVVGFRCGDCRGRWNRHQNPKHDPGCPRALRESLEHKTTKDYFKRPARRAEFKKLSRAYEFAAKLLWADKNLREVSITLTNSRNPNGWHVCLKRSDLGPTLGKVKPTRFIMTEWARRHGYMDVRNGR